MRQPFFWGLVALFVLSLATGVVAEPSSAIRSLTGVTAVRILVEDLSLAVQRTGLQKGQLYTIAQNALTQKGLQVLQPQDSGQVPLVYIRLSSVFGGEEQNAPMSFYLNLQVKQHAVLANTTSAVQPAVTTGEEKPLLVSTWENGTMAMVARKELFFYVKRILTNLVGDLVHDRQEANGLRP
jgi:hypothetical protein